MYRASLNSGVYGGFCYYTTAEKALGIPVTMNNIGSYPIAPIQTVKYEGVPLNHNNFGTYPIVPVISDPNPIININKISNIVRHHTKVSTAVTALAKKLPFSRVVNYIVAKNMLMELFKDDPSINLINDIDKNDYTDPIGGIDDLIASFSSTTLQSLRSVGDGKKREYNEIKEEKESYSPTGPRKYFIGGNWKCNGSIKSVSELADGLSRIDTSGVDVLVAPLPIHLPLVQNKLSKSKIIVSSQNVSATKMGAYTGEIAAKQLQDMGINTTLIGHSERRKYYGETNEIITEKVKIALANKLNIICCLGETLEERKANKVEEVCFASLKAIAAGVGYSGWNNIVIAYEPVWAIGTGVACSPDKARETHGQIRKWFKDNISHDIAKKIRIIYGGSVKPKNCKDLIIQPDIDGFLVGGAALKSDSFGAIIKSVQNESNTNITSNGEKRKIVVCGGGNAAHVFSTLSASNPNNEVHLLSLYKTEAADFKKSLNSTKDKLVIVDKTQEKIQVKGAPCNITNDASCLSDSDIVIISLPAFAHNQYLNAIKNNIKPRKGKKCLVAVFPGASGLECEWQSIFGAKNDYFVLLSCITLPWACRILKFGQNVEILGTKNQIEVCIKKSDNNNSNKKYIEMITDIIGLPPKIVDNGHILNMSLSAINAITHPPIMYAQWKDYKKGKILKKKPLFYQGITKQGAALLSTLSDEVINIIKCVEKDTGLKLVTQHIYDWYKQCYGSECTNTSNLRQCIITNPGYNGLTHPCLKDKKSGGFIPNFKYRYLSEDIPYGLIVIRGLSLILSKKNKCDAPVMDRIIKWAQKKLGKEYLIYKKNGNIIAGKDIKQTRAPQRYGFKSIKELV